MKSILTSLCVICTILLTTASAAGFLTLPFSYKNYTSYQISEGWRYSVYEAAIHGVKQHSGIDYDLPYGTPVLAPFDGYITASYMNQYAGGRTYQGKRVHYAYGRYVQIWNPQTNTFVLLGHLASIAPGIPASMPYPIRGKNGVISWNPTGIVNDPMALQRMIDSPTLYPIGKVKKGQAIGSVGVSGLERGTPMPTIIEVPRYPTPMPDSRDEPHIHMEVFTYMNGKKQLVDPYKIYNEYTTYPQGQGQEYLGGTMFTTLKGGRALFADEK